MKYLAALLALPFASCAVVQSQGGGDATSFSMLDRPNKVSGYLGARSFDFGDEVSDIEDQGVIGVEFSQEYAQWPVGWEAGIMGSAASDDVNGNDIDSATAELYGGVRKSFGTGRFRPYVGAGLSWIRVAFDTDALGEDDDGSLGVYAHGGVAYQFTPLFSLGLDVRGLFGTDIDLYGENLDADYGQVALVAGFSF